MSNYKQTFGIRSRYKRSKTFKSEKGDPGIGFKLTHDNNYDMDNKRLVNVGEPKEHKDAVNKDYLASFHNKNEDIDMKNKAIKNLSWPNDNNDAVPKKYLYQYGLLLDNKINSFNAKDKKIVNVLDPENLQDVATKNYVDSLDSAIQDSLIKRITDANNNRIKNVGDPVEDGDAVNKKHLYQIINPQISEPILPTNSADWIRFYTMDLNLFNTVDPRVFILKGTVNINQDVGPKSNWIGNVPLKDKPTCPIGLLVWHFEDNKTYDFIQDDPQILSRRSIIDQNKRLIVYGNLKGGSTLYFNSLISIQWNSN
jgi:hypothetical protein